jgi:hypothetical protein
MRAVSAALVLLAGVLLFGVGYVRVSFRGEDSVAVIVCFSGIILGGFGLVAWLLSFIADRGKAE